MQIDILILVNKNFLFQIKSTQISTLKCHIIYKMFGKLSENRIYRQDNILKRYTARFKNISSINIYFVKKRTTATSSRSITLCKQSKSKIV